MVLVESGPYTVGLDGHIRLEYSHLFPGTPGVIYSLHMFLVATANCPESLPMTACHAFAGVWDSAGLRITGDYVSLGGVTYAGLDEVSAVPEPTSWALLGAGLALIGGRRLLRRWLRRCSLGRLCPQAMGSSDMPIKQAIPLLGYR